MKAGLRITVTGGAGFIGSNLVHQLLRNPAIGAVTVIDDCSTGTVERLAADRAAIDFRLASILDPDAVTDAVAGADAVVHLAALGSVPRSIQHPLASHHANATGTLQVLEACRHANGPLLIAASSSSVYGANPRLPRVEDSATMPVSPYAVTKLATEAYLGAYHASFGLPVLPLRLFNVFGPGQRAGHPYAAVIPRFIAAMLAGEPIVVHGDGTQTRDWTFVDTVCQVIGAAIVNRVSSPWPVNLAFGTQHSVLEVATEIADLLGRELTIEHTAPRPGDVAHSHADPARLRALFPAVTTCGLREGLARTIAWHHDLSEESRCTS
ncbi:MULTISPECIES: NAD-dependent epimerase/dehydratase family protein [Nocardia]|uniref:NAD-dependent epimerase/dehydratase family protein n=1 Tax=Nocardia thailandica TaxID=257275 RepID=A0ABW6PWA1_9NOCA|nr:MULTISPECIES: NAD-dependent epimerase/dehydratase family protein [Nocardia]